MKRGDECWVPWTRWDGTGGEEWHPRRWTWLYTSNDRAELDDPSNPGSGGHCEPEDLCHTREECEALIALRAAAEAVAKARDAVVEAARRYVGTYAEGLRVTDAVMVLDQAERAEAEARARMEALR